mmetsp:Transcript_85786/g.179241  ORF Transcript_85786/g.179241 Transcript_85786/m.179241 type:complete len:116 (+) Transcript_85786:2-349(+)
MPTHIKNKELPRPWTRSCYTDKMSAMQKTRAMQGAQKVKTCIEVQVEPWLAPSKELLPKCFAALHEAAQDRKTEELHTPHQITQRCRARSFAATEELQLQCELHVKIGVKGLFSR